MKTIMMLMMVVVAMTMTGCAGTTYTVGQDAFTGVPAEATVLLVVNPLKKQVCPVPEIMI